MEEINLRRILDEMDSKKSNKVKRAEREIIEAINDPDTNNFVLLYTTDEGGGTIGVMKDNSKDREKMAKTALHLVSEIAKER